MPLPPRWRRHSLNVQLGRHAPRRESGRLQLGKQWRQLFRSLHGLGSVGWCKVFGTMSPKTSATGLGSGERGTGPRRDHMTLLLGERRIDVKHERVSIGSKLGYDERHPLRHQPRNEGHVPRQAIELRHDHGSLVPASLLERLSQLWTAIEGISPLSGLDLDMLGDDLEAIGLGEARDRLALRFQS